MKLIVILITRTWNPIVGIQLVDNRMKLVEYTCYAKVKRYYCWKKWQRYAKSYMRQKSEEYKDQTWFSYQRLKIIGKIPCVSFTN